MLCVLIGDSAGNFSALDAAISDAEEAGIMTILHTGNAAAGAAEPNACVRRLQESGALCVQGGMDRNLVRFIRKRAQLERRLSAEDFAALATVSGRIGSTVLEWLGALPKTRRIEVDGVTMLLAHAAPDGTAKALTQDTPAHVFARYREDAACALIVTGGNAPPFHRWEADTLFVHPGPVHTGGDTAHYTVVDTDAAPWRVEERHVAL